MKITKFLNSPLVPHFTSGLKCGALPGAAILGAAGISSGAGLLGGMFSAASQSDINSQNIANSFTMNAINNAFTASENAKNRRWQANEYDRRFYKESAEWYNQQQFASDLSQMVFEQQQETAYQYWKQQQEYESPLNQLQRFNQAGLNGAALISGQQFGGTGLSSAPSTPSASVPSPSPSSSAVGASGGSVAQAVNPMSSLIDSVVKVAQSSEHSAHANEMWQLIAPKLRDYSTRADLQEVTKEGLLLDQDIKNAKLPHELKILAQEYLNAVADEQVSYALVGKYNADRLESIAKRVNIYATTRNLDVEHKLLLARLAWFDKQQQSVIDTARSEQEKNRAEARQASSVADSNEFMLSIQKQPEVRTALCDQILQAAENAKAQKKLTDKQADNIKWQTEQLKKATDNYEIQMWAQIINQSINTAANAIGEFTKFGLAKKFLQSPSSSPLHSGQGYMMQDGVLMLNPVK